MTPRLSVFGAAICGALLALAVPALATHHTISVTNNTDKPITSLLFDFRPDETCEGCKGRGLSPRNVHIAPGAVVRIALPDTIRQVGSPLSVASDCRIDVKLLFGSSSYWMRGKDLCADPYLDVRASSAYAYSSYALATPFPKASSAIATPAPTATPRTPSDEAVHRGDQLFGRSRFKDALPFFDQAIKLNSQNAFAYAYRGRTHYQLNQFDRALSDYDRGLQITPTDNLLHYLRGYTDWALNLDESAIEDFGSDIQVSALQAWMTYLSAIVQRERGQNAPAQTLLLACKRSKPCRTDGDYPKIRYLLGEITPRVLLATAKTESERVDRHAVIGLTLLQRRDTAAARNAVVLGLGTCQTHRHLASNYPPTPQRQEVSA